jgi:uncharacterized membrane protein (UPF0127 family)/O-antigen ligase
MPHRVNYFKSYLRRFGVWGLVLSLHGVILSPFLGAPQFSFGIWSQSEPILIGLHFCAALAATSLGMIVYSTRKLGMLAWHPIVLFPLGLAFWSFLVGFTHDLPSLNWFGSPPLGEGLLWYLELALFTAAAGIVIKFRVPRIFLASSAIGVTCIITALTIRFLDTKLIQPIAFHFSDHLAFSGIFIVAIAFIYLKETNFLIHAAAVILGLFVIYYSSNRAAWGFVYIAAPIFAYIGLLLARRVSSRILRFSAAIIITFFVLVLTTLLSTVDFRPYVEKFASYEGGTLGTQIHSAINSQLTRQHLHTLSLEVIKNQPSLLATGQGWGMFSDNFASHLPIDWVKLRDDDGSMSKSEQWIRKGHWDAVNRVDFHSHNSFLEALLSAGIIGAILFLGIILAPLIWCRKKIIILASVFGFTTAGLFTQWFQVPSSFPMLALALGGFIAPVKSKNFFSILKKIVPYFLAGISIMLLIVGIVTYNFAPYAYFYMPKMTTPLTDHKGQFVCPSRFDDQGRGGIHLAHRLRSMARYVRIKIFKADDPNLNIEDYYLNHFRGLICASENYIERGASTRLLIAALNTRSELAFLDVPHEMKPMVEKYIQSWGTRVRQFLTRAPKRTDMAAPYLLYLLKIGDEKKFFNLATKLFVRNKEDPIALWFSGIALLSKKNMGQAGTQRMRKALKIGVERLIPVDQALKRELVPNKSVSIIKKKRLIIKIGSGAVPIEAELAITQPARRRIQRGKTSLPLGSGMLLLFPEDGILGTDKKEIWMKDTHISLDLLFIDSKGKIRKIVERTVPRSLISFSSDEDIKGVLEVNAGFAEQFEIRVGDDVAPANIFLD